MTTREDVYRAFRNRIRTTPSTLLDPAAVDVPGSLVNNVANATSDVALVLDTENDARRASVFVSTARGADLDRWIAELTKGSLPRKAASASQFSFVVYRPTPSPGPSPGGTIAAGTPVLVGGLVYTLDDPLFWASGQDGIQAGQQANFTCATLGSIGNQAGKGMVFQNPSALFDLTFALAIPDVGFSVGGAEQESDVDYRARFSLFNAGLDRGLLFLPAGALSVPGVVFANAIEDVTVDALGNIIPTGAVSLYIADVNGRANQALITKVANALLAYRMQGQWVKITGAEPTTVTMVLHFAVSSSFNVSAVQNAVVAALVQFINATGAGQTLLVAQLAAVIQGVGGVVIEGSAPTGISLLQGAPPVDLAPAAASTIFRTDPSQFSFV